MLFSCFNLLNKWCFYNFSPTVQWYYLVGIAVLYLVGYIIFRASETQRCEFAKDPGNAAMKSKFLKMMPIFFKFLNKNFNFYRFRDFANCRRSQTSYFRLVGYCPPPQLLGRDLDSMGLGFACR